MNEQEQIKKIEEEINHLTDQLRIQYQTIQQLKKQLQQLTNTIECKSVSAMSTSDKPAKTHTNILPLF